MVVYILLLIPVAAISYLFGSLKSLVLASNFIFHANMRRLGRGNDFLANFRRVYGIKGALELLAVELVKDIIPIMIGGLILGIKGHSDAGKAFAGFCIVMGSLYPLFYNLRGNHGIVPLIVAAGFMDASLGIVVAVVVIGILYFTKYISLAAVAGAVFMAIASLLILEDNLLIILAVLTAALVLVKHIPALRRIVKGQEEKYSFRLDLSYKFDEKF